MPGVGPSVCPRVMRLPPWDDIRSTRIRANGSVKVRQTLFYVQAKLVGTTVWLVEEPDSLLIFDNNGTQLIDYPWPEHGTKSVGLRSRNNPEVSPMS